MLWKQQNWLSIVICLVIVSSALGVNIEKIRLKEQTIFRLENSILKVDIAASSGARILSLIPKCDGIERVWWKNDGRSGLLDDKAGFTSLSYKTKILINTKHCVKIAFSAAQTDLRITKIISLYENEPTLRIRYIYTNIGNTRMLSTHMVRNYYLAGGKAGIEDVYYWRGARGVEHKQYPYGGTGVYHKVERPWYAVLDKNKRTGMTWLINSPALLRFYNWAANSARNPAIEWQIKLNLSAGESLSVPVVMGFVKGLRGISDVSTECVVYVETMSNGKTLNLNVQCYPLRKIENNNPVSLRCDYETLDRHSVGGETGIYFRSCVPGNVSSGTTVFHFPEEGTYVVCAKLQLRGKVLNDFEFPVVVGKSSGEYYKGKRKKRISQKLVTITQDDVTNGYVLHWCGKAPFMRADELKFAIGTDEFESIGLGILALRDIGKVKINIKSQAIPVDAIRIKSQQGVGGIGKVLSEEQYALIDKASLTMPACAHKSFWLIFSGYRLRAGSYSFQISVNPTKAPQQKIEGTINVIPARRLTARSASLRMYHTLHYIQNKGHAGLMVSHYVRHLMLYFPFKIWRNAIKINVEKTGNLKVDFAGLDRQLKPLIEAGFKTVELMYNFYNKNWFEPIKSLSKKKELQKRFGRKLIQHLFDLGFKDVWYCAMDEPSVSDATKANTIRRLKLIKSLHPHLKLDIAINHYSPKLINVLNRYVDVWIPSLELCNTLLEDIQSGIVKVDSTDEIAFYAQARYFSSPDRMRMLGWQAAWYGINSYSIFAYNQSSRNHPDWKIFVLDSKGYPVTTPAFEGLRDGFEDYEYWQQLKSELVSLEQIQNKLSPVQKKTFLQAKQFKKNVFAHKNNSKLNVKVVPGGNGGRQRYTFVNPNRWKFLAIKETLLRYIVELEHIIKLYNGRTGQ